LDDIFIFVFILIIDFSHVNLIPLFEACWTSSQKIKNFDDSTRATSTSSPLEHFEHITRIKEIKS